MYTKTEALYLNLALVAGIVVVLLDVLVWRAM